MALIRNDDVAIVILAGGKATRFPGKLEVPVDGTPLLERVYRQFRDRAHVTIAGAGSFSTTLDAVLDCPLVIDRWPGRGPLGGLLSACTQLSVARVFAVAGDAPHVTPAVLDALLHAWDDGTEAAVPIHGVRREPLAALYDRQAVLHEGFDVLHEGDASMQSLLARLRTLEVPLRAEFFTNINTIADVV